MDILINVVLPLSLAIIMLSLGIGLTGADFKRVAERGRAFAIGAACQVLLVPIVAYAMILAFGLTGEMAAGVMLLSFCPGGVTSNVVSRLARGDVALSVSLTAVVSLLSILTVPPLVGWAVVHFMGDAAPEISVTSLAIAMFLITTLPVALGMAIRRFAPAFALRIEPKLVILASILFVVIVIAAVATNWQLFVDNLASLGPALISLNLIMMVAGLAIAAAAGMSWRERKTMSIEVGIQNGTVGITLAPLIVGASATVPAIGLPSAVYGVTMYLVALPFVLWLRSK
ncbi:bile acid:sodium symporter family protein [Algirhabdus cladophorae]|uniref:bile acid:sodium symporter family protein n=1 Tax=Algirhabdus cladophorae TaxID=3377108 RepID=UPI003B847815